MSDEKQDDIHHLGLSPVVDALCAANEEMSRARGRRVGRQSFPSREIVAAIVEDLRGVLFPGHFGTADVHDESIHYHIGATLDRVVRALREQIFRGVCFAGASAERGCDERAREMTREFVAALPRIRDLLGSDVRAAYEGDPAATSPDETIFCYPGITAITNHRIAHELSRLGVPLLPRMINEMAHAVTGIDIHPGATIGARFFIDHGTGVVIGETSLIGERVRIYQGVTLGAKSFPLDENGRPIKGIPRHPIVEDEVVIYAGATVLGRITVGKGAVLGGNVWVTKDVAPGARISQ